MYDVKEGARARMAVPRITALAKRLGIHIEYNADVDGEGVSPCPFNSCFATNVEKQTVYVSGPAHSIDDLNEVGALLHEMGHVALDVAPKNADEHVILGWEQAVIRAVGYPADLWLEGNADFSINSRMLDVIPGAAAMAGTTTVDTLQRREGSAALRSCLQRCYQLAQHVGIVTSDGQPSTFRRTGRA
jgi:hypothetical protein